MHKKKSTKEKNPAHIKSREKRKKTTTKHVQLKWYKHLSVGVNVGASRFVTFPCIFDRDHNVGMLPFDFTDVCTFSNHDLSDC